jgi:two-component system, chemotaxis family, sensor kinase Cph1
MSTHSSLGAGTPITAGNVDLTNCEREQIHIPGAIQPHGVLLAIKEPEMTILQVSANAADMLGLPPSQLLGRPLSEVMDPTQFRYWEQQVLLKRLDTNPLYLVPIRMGTRQREFEASVHRYDQVLLAQLEEYEPVGKPRTLDAYSSAWCMLTDLQRTKSLAEFYEFAAQGVRRHIGYDRVVIYKFLEDGTGEVLGESKRDDLPSWLGLRYPASDIPKQARELYLRSWIRIIADVHAAPARLIPEDNPLTGKPLDMSCCVLRGVSPIHIQYLKNIGARASMSISIINDDKLWGLIACHNQTPKRVSHEARIACEFLAHSVSLQINGKESTEHQDYFSKLRDHIARMFEYMSVEKPFYLGLVNRSPRILDFFRSSGAAMVVDGEVTLLGETPSAEHVRALLPWLAQQPLENGVYATDRLAQLYPGAGSFREKTSGLLAARLQESSLQWLLWFRPEVVQVVKWAGDPNKPVEVDAHSGEVKLSPRRSFALWKEEKRGCSDPWWLEEREIAAELRRAVIEVILKHVEQLRRLNVDLGRSNSELEAFAYAASHDLKEPLRGIHNYTQLLARSLKSHMEPPDTEKLQTILKLSARMDDLIDSLLAYSRIGQMELLYENVDVNELLQQVLVMLKARLEGVNATIRIPRPLPPAQGDRIRIQEVLQNLIVNAVKYNDKPEKWVEVGWQEKTPVTYYVRDNGIGIDPRHHATIFRIFKRLHPAEDFGGGTGAGLTITQKIIQRHGGRIWLDSIPGQGSTFYFTLGSEQ